MNLVPRMPNEPYTENAEWTLVLGMPNELLEFRMPNEILFHTWVKSLTYARSLASSCSSRGGNAHNIDILVLTKKWDNMKFSYKIKF